MDYNVRYNIDINGAQASKNLSDFQNTTQKTIPPIIANLQKLRKEIGRVNSSFTAMNRIIGVKPKTIKFTIDNNIKKQLKGLQSEINSIKGKTITINTKVNETGGKLITNSKNPITQKGRNRAARGFGSGARGLFGASDVMYAAGFPFPNMIGAAAIGMGVMSITKSAAEYENIMTTVRSILKVTDKDIATFDQRFESMSRNIRQVGVDTKFTTTEVAGAAKYLGMAGLTIEDINNSIKPIANLAIIGDAPLDRMADIVTNIQTAYGLNSKDMGQVSDILASVTTSTNTNVLEMGEAFKFAAPMMSMARISFNEAAAAIGALANAGLKGTVAGTALRAMMTRLLNPTKKGLEVLSKYNVQLYETDKLTGKNKLRSLFDIFSQLRAKDASVQDLTKIFDKIGGNAANNIFTELLKLPDLIKNSIYSGGVADSIAKEKQNTISGKWDKVTSQFTETGMNVFEAFNPIIKSGLDDLLVILQQPGTAKMFSDIATGIVTLTKALLGLTKWVTDNWYWLESILIGGFLSKKIFSIASSLTSLGSALTSTLTKTRGLTAAIGVAGTAGATGAAGSGLLAALGGIPGLIAAAVAALATFGISVYGAGKQTQSTLDILNKEYEKLNPVFNKETKSENPKQKELTGTDYYDSLGYNLGVRNQLFRGDSNIYSQYYDVLQSRGELEGAKIADKYLVAALGIDDFGSDKIKRLYGDLTEDLVNQKVKYKYNFGPSYLLNQEEQSRGVIALTAIKDLNAQTESKTKQFAEGVNQSIDLGLGALKMIFDLQTKIANGIPLTADESINFIRSITNNDLSEKALGYHVLGPTGDIIFNDKEGAQKTIQKAMSDLVNKNVQPWLLKPLWKSLGVLGDMANISELYSTKTPRIDDNNIEGGISSSKVALSGVGKSSNNQSKHLIINIQSLIGSVNINSTNGEDMEELRDKVTQVIMDAVKDFEISYS